LVNVYGAAQKENKDNFLWELATTCSNVKEPMMIGGDFNILQNSDEKNKPCVIGRCSQLFITIIEHQGLIDLELSDKKFTWSNNKDPLRSKSLTDFLLAWTRIYYIVVQGLNI
jgi:hypothetical protein